MLKKLHSLVKSKGAGRRKRTPAPLHRRCLKEAKALYSHQLVYESLPPPIGIVVLVRAGVVWSGAGTLAVALEPLVRAGVMRSP